MSWIPCPVCGAPRSDTVRGPDGAHVYGCAQCHDAGWVRPYDAADDYAGRTPEAQAAWLASEPGWVIQDRSELKHQLSSRIVRHIAEAEGMTPAEYGSVYDSEKHEQLLIDLMKMIDEDRRG